MKLNLLKAGAVALASIAATVGAADATELRLGGVHSPNSFETEALNRFAELAGEMSGGELKVTVYPAGQLGDERSMIDMINTGAIDMFANVADWNQHLVKDFAVLSMPFAFQDIDHLKSFQASTTYQEMKERMRTEKGVRVLADNWYRLPRVLLTKESVESIEDLNGRKLRMPDIESFIKAWSAFGASPAIIPFSEAFLSLKTGVVDGMEAPISSIYAQNFYQVAPYVTMTNHGLAPFNIMINEAVFTRLDAAAQKVLVDAAEQAGDFYTSSIAEDFEPQKEKMVAEGTTFTSIDLTPFAERVMEVAKDFESQGVWTTGLFAEIQSQKN